MNKGPLFTARWHILKGEPIPPGPAVEETLSLLQTVLGPLEQPAPETPPIIVIPPAEVPGGLRVAFVVGHNQAEPGAYVGDLSEFKLNGQIAEAIKALPKTFTSEVFYRYSSSGYSVEIDTAYARVSAWKPDFIVEIHFNGGGANYNVVLYAAGSVLGRDAAASMSKVFESELGIPSWTGGSPKGTMPKVRTDRGGRSLWAAKAPTVMLEPFFGDRSDHRAKVEALGVTGMAKIYIKATEAALSTIFN